MQYAVCSMQYAVCSIQYAVCSMQYGKQVEHFEYVGESLMLTSSGLNYGGKP